MVAMVLQQCFHLRNCEYSAVQLSPGNIIFASCQRRSCVGRCVISLADVPQKKVVSRHDFSLSHIQLGLPTDLQGGFFTCTCCESITNWIANSVH